MSRAVVTVGVGAWHPKGVDRLARSLKRVGFDGEVLAWVDEYPPGSPSHQDNPYAFKVYAMMEARRRGVDSALWLDASCWAIRPLGELFDLIENQGYAFSNAGWSTGQWCSDLSLPILGVSREEAMKIPMIAATAMGLHFESSAATSFMADWQRHCWDGAFRGPWRNDTGQASSDPRVMGHRHDQSSASVIIDKMGLKRIDPPKFFAYWSEKPAAETCIVARGMRGDESDLEVTNDLQLA